MSRRPPFKGVGDVLDRVLGGALSALMGLLVLDVLWQVFTRFVLGDPSQFTDELARYLLIWVGMLGAAYAFGRRMHLAIDLLPQRLSGRARHVLGVGIDAVTLTFAVVVLIIGGARLVALTFVLRQTSAAMELPLAVVYAVLPLSGVIIAFYAIQSMVEHVRAARAPRPTPAEPEAVAEVGAGVAAGTRFD